MERNVESKCNKKFAVDMPQNEMTSHNFPECCKSKVKNIREQPKCEHCSAHLFSSELKGFCCRSGNIQLKDYIPDVPQPLKDMLKRDQKVLDNLRGLNSSFSMMSLGFESKSKSGAVQNGETIMPGYSPTLKFHGNMYHRMPPLKPSDGQNRKFAQWFIHDGLLSAQEEAQGRINVHRNTSKYDMDTMLKLQEMLHENNVLVKDFKMIAELEPDDAKNLQFILKENGKPQQGHKNQYNLPTGHQTEHVLVHSKKGHKGQYHLPSGHGSTEVGLVTIDDQPEGMSMQVYPREGADMEVYVEGGNIQSWTDLNCYFDPLHFVLIHPYGNKKGWTWKLKQSNGKNLSPAMFYRYMLQFRDETLFFNNILRSRRLMQEYVCAMFYKIERQRLKYILANQKTLRVEKRQGLMDAIHAEDDPDQIGDRIILPASFTNSPRWYSQKYQDSMAILREFGTPHFFITFTANAKWPQITESLHEGETSHDRPDIVVRVFHEHYKEFLHDLKYNDMVGRCIALVAMIEFQKR